MVSLLQKAQRHTKGSDYPVKMMIIMRTVIPNVGVLQSTILINHPAYRVYYGDSLAVICSSNSFIQSVVHAMRVEKHFHSHSMPHLIMSVSTWRAMTVSVILVMQITKEISKIKRTQYLDGQKSSMNIMHRHV